jgi:hypothetical protein
MKKKNDANENFSTDIAALQRKIGEWDSCCNKVHTFIKKVLSSKFQTEAGFACKAPPHAFGIPLGTLH